MNGVYLHMYDTHTYTYLGRYCNHRKIHSWIGSVLSEIFCVLWQQICRTKVNCYTTVNITKSKKQRRDVKKFDRESEIFIFFKVQLSVRVKYQTKIRDLKKLKIRFKTTKKHAANKSLKQNGVPFQKRPNKKCQLANLL